MPLNVGDTVAGRYLIVERLGAGGMGVVFRARDATLDRDIALKALLPHVGQDPALLERFRREARVLAMLRNPGIITVFDLVTTDDGSTALILEYVAGGSLEDQIAQGPMEWRRVAQVGVASAEALAEAHEAGVVHRDIKPSNILLEPDGAVRIADFGIARIAGEVTMSAQGESIGTPAYMSPEQAMGEVAGPASDVYSLGAVLFAAATGRAPYDTGEGGFAAALAHINQPVPDPRSVRPDLPDAAAAVIMRAMQKDPTARFASAAEFASSLRTAAALATSDIPVPMPVAPPFDGPPTPVPASAPATPPPPPPPPPVAPAAAMPPPPADATQVAAASAPPGVVPPPPPGAVPPPPAPPAGGMPPMPSIPPPPGQLDGGGGDGSKRGILIAGIAALVVIVVGGAIAFFVTRSGSSDAEPPVPTASPTSRPTTSPTVRPVSPTPTTPTTPTTVPSTPTQQASETYSTDFSQEEFETFDGDLGAVLYDNGTLVIAVRDALIVSDVLSPVGPVADVIVDVQASYGEFVDPREGEMGIMCRYENFENHYAFGVRSDGSAFIRKRVNDLVTVLAEDANALPGFLPTYELNAQCLGTSLALVVNGDAVLTAEDSDLLVGRTGLFAATTATDSETVSVFDNYVQVSFFG